MGYKDPGRRRTYAAAWTARRRADWFAGKTCAQCGSSENLQLDHIDPATKVSHRIWSWAEPRRVAELAKCQPLCATCHTHKSAVDGARAGERNSQAKLTAADVMAIRASSLPVRAVAAQYGIGTSQVSRIRRGKKWARLAASPAATQGP